MGRLTNWVTLWVSLFWLMREKRRIKKKEARMILPNRNVHCLFMVLLQTAQHPPHCPTSDMYMYRSCRLGKREKSQQRMRWNQIEPKKKQKMELLHLATTFFSLTCMLVSLFYYYYYFFFFGERLTYTLHVWTCFWCCRCFLIVVAWRAIRPSE